MNKTTSTHIWFVLLVSVAVSILAGCRAETLTVTSIPLSPTATPLMITPTPQHSPTARPPYIQNIPHKSFNIYLEFDYPSNWVLEENTQYKDELIISLLDPRFRTLPTRSPTESHGTPSDFGSVDIWVMPVRPDQNIDTLIESFKQGSSGSSWIKPLNDYKITIDGYGASVFEDQINFPELYTSLMFERN